MKRRLFPGRFTAALMSDEHNRANAGMGITSDIDDLKRLDCLDFGKEIRAASKA